MDRTKKGSVDSTLPSNIKDLEENPNWQETSHPKEKENGRRKFKDVNTGRELEFDEGTKGAPGHRGHDHFHKPNPNATGRHDKYLDAWNNPTPDGSEESHLYPPTWQWW